MSCDKKDATPEVREQADVANSLQPHHLRRHPTHFTLGTAILASPSSKMSHGPHHKLGWNVLDLKGEVPGKLRGLGTPRQQGCLATSLKGLQQDKISDSPLPPTDRHPPPHSTCGK